MLKPKDVSERLNVSVKTLQRWDNGGILIAHRTATNRCYYTEDQIQQLLHPLDTIHRARIAYARVSIIGQKADLKKQLSFLREYAHGRGTILDDVCFEQYCLKFDTKMEEDDDVRRL